MSELDAGGMPPHVAGEFYLWLWFRSDTGPGVLEVPDASPVQYWVDDRISFRIPGEDKVSAVLTGDNPGTTLEARAALRGGKVLRDVRLALRREEREYSVTLRGPGLEIAAAKLPGLLKGGDDAEVLYERMFLYEELHWMIGSLFRQFAEERTSPAWREDVLPRLRAWVASTPVASEEEGFDDGMG